MATIEKSNHRLQWLHIGIIIVAVLLAYGKMYNAGFLAWDDDKYILNNVDIRGLTSTNIKAWFSGFYVGNYQPITMLCYAVEYTLAGLQPFTYHLFGILIHAVNASLVYLFFKQLQPNSAVALVVALLFALHPSQTESVSWVAEQKTVVSACFYLIAMLQYLRYKECPSNKRMAGVFFAGALAMLSKGTAVTLPIALIAIDVWKGDAINEAKTWLSKLSLIGMSLIIGVVAFQGQSSGNFIDGENAHGIVEKIVFGGYAYVQYLVRLFLPVGLSAMYPYPKEPEIIHYLYLFLAGGILFLIYISYRKKLTALAGGLLFYTFNIAIVLQFVPFGEALMADRYMYVACIGLLYPAVYYPFSWLKQHGKEKATLAIGGIAAMLLLSLTFIRNEAWESDTGFFEALAEALPNSAVAQYSLGGMYMKNGDLDMAELHLKQATRIDAGNYKAWYNLGTLYLRKGKAMESLDALNKAIAINGYTKAYLARATLHQAAGKTVQAIADIDNVLKREPKNAKAYFLKAGCYAQHNEMQKALDNYNKALLFGNDAEFYIKRGSVLSKLKRHSEALSDLNTAVTISSGSGAALFYRGIVKYQAGQNPCTDLQAAFAKGYTRAKDALQKLCK